MERLKELTEGPDLITRLFTDVDRRESKETINMMEEAKFTAEGAASAAEDLKDVMGAIGELIYKVITFTAEK